MFSTDDTLSDCLRTKKFSHCRKTCQNPYEKCLHNCRFGYVYVNGTLIDERRRDGQCVLHE